MKNYKPAFKLWATYTTECGKYTYEFCHGFVTADEAMHMIKFGGFRIEQTFVAA